MAETIRHGVGEFDPNFKEVIGDRLGTIGWGLFFLWLGFSFLATVGEGIALAGIGVIILGMQGARSAYGLKFEGFWVVVGSLFMLGGIGIIFQLDIPLFAIVLIGAGVAILWPLVSSSGTNEANEDESSGWQH